MKLTYGNPLKGKRHNLESLVDDTFQQKIEEIAPLAQQTLELSEKIKRERIEYVDKLYEKFENLAQQPVVRDIIGEGGILIYRPYERRSKALKILYVSLPAIVAGISGTLSFFYNTALGIQNQYLSAALGAGVGGLLGGIGSWEINGSLRCYTNLTEDPEIVLTKKGLEIHNLEEGDKEGEKAKQYLLDKNLDSPQIEARLYKKVLERIKQVDSKYENLKIQYEQFQAARIEAGRLEELLPSDIKKLPRTPADNLKQDSEKLPRTIEY